MATAAKSVVCPSPDYVMVPRSAAEEIMRSITGDQPAPVTPDRNASLDEFKKACEIDYRLQPCTVAEHLRHVRRLFRFLGKHPAQATRSDLRSFLAFDTAENAVKALRVFYGRFLGTDLASCFKVPRSYPRLVVVPTREELCHTYNSLKSPELCAAFLMLASSGLRRGELLSLTPSDVDFESWMVRPIESTATKKRWVTFFNQEAGDALNGLIHAKNPSPNERIFTLHPDTLTKKIKAASRGKITPQVLRDWFCDEMGGLGVADRYVDAFCGRVPKSVLARHYTDYSPRKLREIYERAGLRVLEAVDK